MSKTVKSLLYLVLIVAFTSNFVATNAVLDEITQLQTVYINDFTFTIPDNFYAVAVIINGTLNYAALLVIINVINATNKNTEITQGTLDNKQNVSLANDALVMEVLRDIVDTNEILSEEKKAEYQLNLNKQIDLTRKLSNTHIDFKSINIDQKIAGQETIIDSLKLALETAIRTGNKEQEKYIQGSLISAQRALNVLLQRKNK